MWTNKIFLPLGSGQKQEKSAEEKDNQAKEEDKDEDSTLDGGPKKQVCQREHHGIRI